MERIELIVILSMIMGLMFCLGWFGSVIYAYFFGRRTGHNKLIKDIKQELNQAYHQNNELLEHYTKQEEGWQVEINRLKEENNDFLQTHRNYQDKIFLLEQQLREDKSQEN